MLPWSYPLPFPPPPPAPHPPGSSRPPSDSPGGRGGTSYFIPTGTRKNNFQSTGCSIFFILLYFLALRWIPLRGSCAIKQFVNSTFALLAFQPPWFLVSLPGRRELPERCNETKETISYLRAFLSCCGTNRRALANNVTSAQVVIVNKLIWSVGGRSRSGMWLVCDQFCPVYTRKSSARNGKVSIVLRLLHKFHRVNRLLALALHVWTGLMWLVCSRYVVGNADGMWLVRCMTWPVSAQYKIKGCRMDLAGWIASANPVHLFICAHCHWAV